jgi:outer membrane protein OmpA-like peptidoglycan-associated protein
MKGLLHLLFILLPLLSFSQMNITADSLSFYFEFNSHEINFQKKSNSTTKTKLTKLSNQTLILRAYTDSIGSEEYNLKLAELRLESVKKLLNEINPEGFQIQLEIAVGEDLSQRSNSSKRRVDILIPPSNSSIKIERNGRFFELGTPIKLEIQFEYGKDIVLQNSYRDIRFLIETLQADKTLSVTLAGHVCCGTDGNNLSGTRANRIKQILIMEGKIAGNRINAVGFGNKKPLFDDDTEEHKQANRRVEATFYKK